VAIYSTFLQRAYDQIIHDVCIEKLPVIFALDRGGLVGEDGPTHHGQFDLGYLRSLPNMVVMAPKDGNELQRMLVTALHHDGPIAMRYPRGLSADVELDADPAPIEIGKGEVLTRGGDLLILAIGGMVHQSLEAHRRLEEQDIHATVVNCRFVKPLDQELICSLASEIPRIITAEENALQGGFGSAVLEMLADQAVEPFRLKRVGIPDQFVEHGAVGILRKKYGLNDQGIVSAARTLFADASGSQEPRRSPACLVK
jgi:1-deoxy-D-xylulose-5-phosphate synthase